MLIFNFVESQSLKSLQNLYTTEQSENKCSKVYGLFKQNPHLLLSTNSKPLS